ncbi:MAG: hypothetical protein E6J43_06160 [Chloroflexi bacterium]|nr:MAG: hypothetical protein E6J43_06160 [Chloroflexota bacterium]
MSDFEADKKELLADLNQSRAGLILVVEELRPEDFGQARRGSWSISKILDHVIHSERLYTQLVSTFSGNPASGQNAAERFRERYSQLRRSLFVATPN